GLHSLYSTGSSGTSCALRNNTGFATGFAATRFAGPTRRFAVLRAADRFVRIARILFCSFLRPSNHRRISRTTTLLTKLSKLLSPLDDVLVRTFVVTRLLAQRRESPGRLRMIALYAAFTTAMRVIDRVHGYAANRGTNTAPTCTACLAEVFVFMVEIA